MDLERAFDTLGLEPGAAAEEVEAAYRRLCDDFDERIGRVTSLALRDRYAAARAELEAARAAALTTAGRSPAGDADEDPATRAWSVLGLSVGASPLEVASAYVSLCEELDRELDSAPTEALRRRCLEARAEIDAAYQSCAAAPLAEDPASNGSNDSGRYETQMSASTFEAREPEPEPEPVTMTLEVMPDPEPETPRRKRRRPLRRAAAAVFVLGLVAGGAVGYGWWQDASWVHELKRYLPLPPAPELVESQSAAEYLRRRVAEERRDIQRRATDAKARVERLAQEAASETEPQALLRIQVALDQARGRAALATHLAELTEKHIFASGGLAEAYGHMELGAELVAESETQRAVAAFAEARAHLESTLASLDEAEEALGARSEAIAARDAWVALAASAGIAPEESLFDGGERLEAADALLETGDFAGALPELRQASQHFRTALDEGRRIFASRREALEEAERVALAEAETRARAESVARAESERERLARAERRAQIIEDAGGSPAERAAVKLVTIPAGEFLYGCNAGNDRECRPSESPGRNAQVAAFRIDRTEVRVSEYSRCVASGVCAKPSTGTSCNWGTPGRGDHPVNCIDWDQATTYCSWVGKRLPTEEEWEKAARGTDGRLYPWGNEQANCDVAVMAIGDRDGCGSASTAPVGSRELGRSPYGLFDMAGNVLEWTVSLHESGTGVRVLRGGSWRNDASSMRATHRQAALPSLRHESVGFRCAQGAVIADHQAR